MDLPTLYHGTDARLVEMTTKERIQYMLSCRKVIDHLWPFILPLLEQEQRETIIHGQTVFVWDEKIEKYKNNIIKKTNNPFGYYNVRDAITCVQAMKNGNSQYQYGNLYLTSLKEKAFDYARMAFYRGEYGKNAF